MIRKLTFLNNSPANFACSIPRAANPNSSRVPFSLKIVKKLASTIWKKKKNCKIQRDRYKSKYWKIKLPKKKQLDHARLVCFDHASAPSNCFASEWNSLAFPPFFTREERGDADRRNRALYWAQYFFLFNKNKARLGPIYYFGK